MTFGQTLKQLLTVSNVKMAHLAAHLGYDTSYISRWVNDIKMPSLKNNDDLFIKIAEFLISNADESAQNALNELYVRDSSNTSLQNAITNKLMEAYRSADSSSFQLSLNAIFLYNNLGISGTEMFSQAVQQCLNEKHCSEVHCFSSTPLSINSNKDNIFWNTVLTYSSPDEASTVIMNQLVNMQDFARNIDSYCAAICTFSDFHPGIKYEFCKDETDYDWYSNIFISVEDLFLMQNIRMPFSDIYHTLYCTDKAVLSPNYFNMKNKVKNSPKLLEYCSYKNLLDGYFLYNFIMDGQLRYLLNIMHPIYISNELLLHMAHRYFPELSEDGFQVYCNNMCSKANREVVIFRSALIEYIYTGKLFIFDKVRIIDREDRQKHLQQLLEDMISGNCSITIIDENNPLLSKKDMNLSLFLSKSSGFAISAAKYNYALKLQSNRALLYFNKFFEHLQQLPSDYALSGESAIGFIQRGLMLI